MFRGAVAAGAVVGLAGATSMPVPTGCCEVLAAPGSPPFVQSTYTDNVMQFNCQGVHHSLKTCDQVRCPGANQKWNDCESACPPTCGIAPGGMCTMQCVIGCSCKADFKRTARDAELECVAQCPGEVEPTAQPTPRPTPTADVCSLQAGVTGPCRAAMPRWTYNSRSNTCVQFTYGGCGGNANRFSSQEQCEAGCVVATGCCEQTAVTWPRPAGTFRDDVLASDCRAAPGTVGMGYTHHAGQSCDEVRCPGNNQKWHECESACPPTCSIPSGGMCTRQCVIGCGCKDGFKRTARGTADFECVLEAACPSTATASPTDAPEDDEDVCSLPAATGRCRAAITKWYYNSDSNACETFIYGGCGGNANRYDSQALCQRSGCAVAGTTWRNCRAPQPMARSVGGFRCNRNGWCKGLPSLDACRALKEGNCNGEDCAGAIWRANRPSNKWNCRLCASVQRVKSHRNDDFFALAAAKEAEPRASAPSAAVVAGGIAGAVAAVAAAAAACIVVARRRSASAEPQDALSAEQYHKDTQDV